PNYSVLFLSLFLCLSFFTSLLFQCSRHHRNLHSFPTRRSSDLQVDLKEDGTPDYPEIEKRIHPGLKMVYIQRSRGYSLRPSLFRSEEHTSELQSRFDLVCRLLLEKKNNN